MTQAATLPIEVGPGETVQEKASRLAVAGLAPNAFVMLLFGQHSNFVAGDELGQVHESLKKAVARTKAGGTDQADELLTAQAAALNIVFAELARRASLNMGVNLGATETYLRLALKAQSQCRSTLETLAEIRQPRQAVFAKQANIAAGHQQVNNGVATPMEEPARAEVVFPQNELLEAKTYGNGMEPGAQGQDGRRDPPLEAVGAIDRPPRRARKRARQS